MLAINAAGMQVAVPSQPCNAKVEQRRSEGPRIPVRPTRNPFGHDGPAPNLDTRLRISLPS